MVWYCVCIVNVNVAVRDDAENRFISDTQNTHRCLCASRSLPAQCLMSATALLKPTAASGQSAGTLSCPSHVQDHPGGATPARPHGVLAPEVGRDRLTGPTWVICISVSILSIHETDGAGGGPQRAGTGLLGQYMFPFLSVPFMDSRRRRWAVTG